MSQVPEASGQPAADDETPVLPDPPVAVAGLASERQLGQLHDARVVTGAWTIGRMALIVGAVALVPTVVGFQGGNAILVLIGMAGLFGILIALVIGAYAIKTAAAGADDWYLYTNGVVARRRRQLQAATWREVGIVTRKRMGNLAKSKGMMGATLINPQTVRGYELDLRGGGTVFLTAVDAFEDGQRLGGRLEQLASQAGVPVAG